MDFGVGKNNILSIVQLDLLYKFMNDGIIELSKRKKHTIQRAIKHGEYNSGQQELFNDLRDRYIKQIKSRSIEYE